MNGKGKQKNSLAIVFPTETKTYADEVNKTKRKRFPFSYADLIRRYNMIVVAEMRTRMLVVRLFPEN